MKISLCQELIQQLSLCSHKVLAEKLGDENKKLKMAYQRFIDGDLPALAELQGPFENSDWYPQASSREQARQAALAELSKRGLLSELQEPIARDAARLPNARDETAPQQKPVLSRQELKTVFLALDLAVEKIRKEFSCASGQKAASLEKSGQDQRSFISFYFPEGYSPHTRGIERHCLGENRGAAEAVFRDVHWMASTLLLTNYSADTIAAAILLHADNSLGGDGGKWLAEALQSFSSRTGDILAVVRSGQPDPNRTPLGVSILSCQRPLEIAKDGRPEVIKEARAIAIASVLSPAYPASFGELMDVIPFLRDPSVPDYFTRRLRERCAELGREKSGLYEKRDNTTLGCREIQATAEVLRGLFSDPQEGVSREQLLSSLHHSFSLAFRVIGEGGSLRTICEGVTHPFFDSVKNDRREWARKYAAKNEALFNVWEGAHVREVATEADGRLSETSGEEAERAIASIASEIAARIPPAQRQARWFSGILDSFDFSASTREERILAAIESLEMGAVSGNSGSMRLAEIVSENRPEIIARVEKTYLDRLSQNAGKIGDLTRELWRMSHHGGLERALGEAQLPASFDEKTAAAFFRDRVEPVQLGLQKALFDIELVLKERASMVKCNQEAGLQAICSLLDAEVAEGLTRWNATSNRKALGMSLGLPSANDLEKWAVRALYTADDQEKFGRASRMMMGQVLKHEATGTPRDQAASYRHALEVGMTLALCRAPTDVVVAGILHDLYELVSKADRDAAKASADHEPQLPKIREQVKEGFGAQVCDLIEMVSEIRSEFGETEQEFLDRKMAVFKKVQGRFADDPECARKGVAILLASKVSTLADGLLQVEEKGDAKGWSKGDFLDNVQVMLETHVLARTVSEGSAVASLFDELLLRWCEAAGPGVSRLRLAREYLEGSGRLVPDHGKAFQLFLAGAKSGDAGALYFLGQCYMNGWGTAKSGSRAAELFNCSLRHQEAARESLRAQESVSREFFMHEQDEYSLLKRIYRGVDHQEEAGEEQQEVLTLLHKAAERGDAGSAYQLGLCCLYGWGMPASSQRALKLFEVAAHLLELRGEDDRHPGYLASGVFHELARIYDAGMDGMPPDPAKAFKFYERAARSNGEDGVLSMLACAEMYEQGRGVERDLEMGRAYRHSAVGGWT